MIEVKITELAYIAEQIASCDPTVVAETLGFQDLTPFQETEAERLINEMLLVWSRGDQSHIEPRQDLARKLLELDTKYNGVPEQKPDFKTLAQELDIHGMLCVLSHNMLYIFIFFLSVVRPTSSVNM